MIDYELFCKIKHLKEHEGLTAPQIAQELALDPRTVAKWLAHGQFCQRKPAPRPSKLDPFKKDIARMLENHPYSAAQILQRIGEHGGRVEPDFTSGGGRTELQIRWPDGDDEQPPLHQA